MRMRWLRSRHGKWSKVRPVIALVCALGFALSLTMAGCYALVAWQAAGRLYDDLGEVPQRDVALVLGTSRYVAGGGHNLFFKYRMEAAAQLCREGKCRHLIVSGDNRHKSYDEPSEMKDVLMGLGVPEEAITCDYAGLRTLDSVVRVKEIFSQDRVIVVSQPFHNARAVFIARHQGIDAVGFNARDVPGYYRIKTRLREILARCKACLDVYVLGTEPEFLGEKVDVPV